MLLLLFQGFTGNGFFARALVAAVSRYLLSRIGGHKVMNLIRD
jgi:hypothetical protein